MSGKKLFEGVDLSGFGEIVKQDRQRAEGKTQQGQTTLSLASIIEDPDQPRTVFDDDALQELAASIKKRGVLQSIVVRPANESGKHVIVMGARRFRASQLAGKDTIPAVIRADASDGYDQMIENIQREALSHQDVARFIRDRLAKGDKQSAIAADLGKPRPWVSPYVEFFDMDPAIQSGVETYGMRTAYELHAAMKLDPERTRAFMADNDAITQRAARELAQSIRGKASVPTPESAIAQPAPAGEGGADDGQEGETPVSAPGALAPDRSKDGGEPAKPRGQGAANDEARASGRFAVMVRTGERIGRLALDQPAKQGSNFGTVVLDNGDSIIEVAVKELEIIEIVKLD